MCLATAIACSSEASNPAGATGNPGTGGAAGPGGAGGAGASAQTGGSGGAAIAPRSCRIGDACAEGAECAWWFIETGVSCNCDPSGHVFCDPHGGGGSPPWPPCTEQAAADDSGACQEEGATTCTETNGWCTRTCTCGGTCETTCEGEGPTEPQKGFLCDVGYCSENEYGGCEIIDGDCDYKVQCDGGQATVTGSCP